MFFSLEKIGSGKKKTEEAVSYEPFNFQEKRFSILSFPFCSRYLGCTSTFFTQLSLSYRNIRTYFCAIINIYKKRF